MLQKNFPARKLARQRRAQNEPVTNEELAIARDVRTKKPLKDANGMLLRIRPQGG